MAANGINVLLVDDSATIRRIICKILAQIGIEHVDEALNGAEALKKLKENSYRLILSDWNMEPVGGLELLQRIRANEALRDVPFIMVSSNDSTRHVIRAKEAGADSYIIKPFTAKNLKMKISRVLNVEEAELIAY